MKEYCYSEDFRKRSFFFLSDDHSLPDGIEIDAEVSIRVKDEQGEVLEIPFRVIRNRHFNENVWWVYGEVLNSPAGDYRQIEIRLNKKKPNIDTIDVFAQAPPQKFKTPTS